MKKLKRIFYPLLAAMFGISAAFTSSCGGDKVIDVFILAGQSNMEGYAAGSSLDAKYKHDYPNVRMYYVGSDEANNGEMRKWTTVKFGQGANKKYDHFGPELGMAEVMWNSGKNIAFIKYAFGGSAIYQKEGFNHITDGEGNKIACPNWHGTWDGATAGDFYEGLFSTVNTAVSELKSKGYLPRIRGFVWMQGETDGEIQFNDGTHKGADNYEHNLTELFSAVRAELNEPGLPIVFGEIYEYSQPLSIEQGGRGRDIVAAQRNVGNLPDNYLVNTGDLVIDASVDPWHWQGQSARLLGVRFGEKMYEAVYMNATGNQTEYKKGEVYGKVFDNYGNPVSGVTVSAGNQITQTDGDGSYLISVNRATDNVILFEKEGFGSVTRLVRANRYKNGKLRNVESFMHRKATIEGIVETEEGSPLSGVSVVCGSQRVISDENGRYVLSVFPEVFSANAKYEIVFSKDGYSSAVYTHTFGYTAKTIGYDTDLGVLKLNGKA
ncbi:MAG: hypothetical protein J6Z34_04260 [Clostridia bacterium]|nr:hypothetical protein [Clostridia bacterium]